MSEYFIPAGPGEAEFTEKRSRFLGHIRPVESEEEAKAFINQVKKEHYDARHNCWCYLLRGGVERYSDDGEPQGTAGIPMLEVFRREGVTDYDTLLDYANPDSTNYKEMVEEIGKELKFTSLRYHRLDDMIDSVGIEPCKLCTYCWSGRE